ncbi:MAG: hypothetical protein QOJ81_1617 [Chloroflexota bacterium]|nr:hypothetical protein [Chloroflexota bacterium]
MWLIGLYIVALLSLPVDIGLNVGGAVITPARLVLLFAVVLALLEWRFVLLNIGRLPKLVWVGWAAFLGAALITAIVSPSVASWARYVSIVGEGLVVFVLVCHAAGTPGGVRTLITVFAVTMVSVAAIVLLLAAMGQHYDYILSGLAGTEPAGVASPRYGLERQAGPFRAALYFAIGLTAASALLLPAIARGATRTRSLAIAAWLLLLVAVIFLTASRLAMTTIFLIPAAYFLVRGPRLIGTASLVAAFAVASGLTLLIPASPVIEESNSLRLSAISPALQAIAARPLFGWGLLNDMSVLSGILGTKNYVDDTYLSLAIETGLVGLGAFVLLAATIVAATLRDWSSARGLALAIALASLLGMAVFASFLQSTQGYAAFFVLAALAVAAAVRSDERGQPEAAT